VLLRRRAEDVMKRQAGIVVAAAMGVVALTVTCRKPESGPTATRTTSATTSMLAPGDRDFVAMAARASMLEVALGRKAAPDAGSPDVKAFGRRMVADYEKMNAELEHLAKTKGIDAPDELDGAGKKQVDAVLARKGRDLDERYVRRIVDDHEEVVETFRKASRDLGDPDLRAWAAKALPAVERHLAEARALGR
jgi:putative membrane protein